MIPLTVLLLAAARLPLPQNVGGWQQATAAGPLAAGEFTTYAAGPDGMYFTRCNVWVLAPCGWSTFKNERLVLLTAQLLVTEDGESLIARRLDDLCPAKVPSADFDFDGDVDQSDFGILQRMNPPPMTVEQFQEQATGARQ